MRRVGDRNVESSWPGLHPGGKGSVLLIHPADAADLGIGEGEVVRVHSPVGAVQLRALLSDRPGAGCSSWLTAGGRGFLIRGVVLRHKPSG